jgi:hypothetical protein
LAAIFAVVLSARFIRAEGKPCLGKDVLMREFFSSARPPVSSKTNRDGLSAGVPGSFSTGSSMEVA